jgi:NET1-associated nuclear protein 1 (U3 small nucleolar RNA-associated protein 17)
MAVHPTESILAIGDYSGKITLLFIDSHKSEKLPVSSQFHWHSHKVNCITFSADGNYLLSGGEEAVLVLWQFQTGSRQFLPRLGAEISSIRISQNQGLYLISLKDNGVKIVNSSNLSIVKDIHGLTAAYFDRNNYPMSVGILADPINDTIMLNGVPGSLQFYDIESQRSKYQVCFSYKG